MSFYFWILPGLLLGWMITPQLAVRYEQRFAKVIRINAAREISEINNFFEDLQEDMNFCRGAELSPLPGPANPLFLPVDA
jgi:hypothetical protein